MNLNQNRQSKDPIFGIRILYKVYKVQDNEYYRFFFNKKGENVKIINKNIYS